METVVTTWISLLLVVCSASTPLTADSIETTPESTTTGNVDLQPGQKPPVAPTYRNAYGTHFECSSTCVLLLWAHVVLVVGALLLLSLVPVRFASDEKLETPFVLWFGSPQKKKPKEEEVTPTESLCSRVSTWLVSSLFGASPTPGADARYQFHADMAQQLAAAKTYDSITVAASPPPSPKKATSRSSIFVGAPPSPPRLSRRRQPSSRRASTMNVRRSEPPEQRTSRAALGGEGPVETKEDLVRRRQSLEVRAERRVARVQEDVSYENLGDDEIRSYEYLEFLRELLDGLSLKKVCQKSGRVVSRTLYITPDMKVVYWNPAGAIKWLSTKSSLQAVKIELVLKGLHGSASVTSRSSPERDSRCVSIKCSDGKWLVLEAKTEAMRQRLYLGFSRLAHENQGQEQEQEAVAVAEHHLASLAAQPRELAEEFLAGAKMLPSGSRGGRVGRDQVFGEEEEEKMEGALSPVENDGDDIKDDPESSRR
ncbi:hypothetical protein PHYBOEH_007512 [Phytophthora boehmeriae]|uniref:RanBD1 domain-containing protein n=1 Tax=Phytophthora boehmeriae TaxID=109152 RepID=A0A8T1W606_9STRA|nr:hypothetical protein PHYBOEH_007512 [Phytophthora boehmeriae]